MIKVFPRSTDVPRFALEPTNHSSPYKRLRCGSRSSLVTQPASSQHVLNSSPPFTYLYHKVLDLITFQFIPITQTLPDIVECNPNLILIDLTEKEFKLTLKRKVVVLCWNHQLGPRGNQHRTLGSKLACFCLNFLKTKFIWKPICNLLIGRMRNRIMMVVLVTMVTPLLGLHIDDQFHDPYFLPRRHSS